MKDLSGIITPTVSPFRGGKIDEVAIEKLMEHLHKIGVTGVFPMGSNGVSPFVTNTVHKRILDLFSKFRNGNELFVPGVGKNNVEDTIELSRYAADLDSDAVVIVTPYYMKVSQESLYVYFAEVVKKIEVPVLLYNIPQMTGNTIEADTVIRLAKEFSNIAGVKESSGNISLFQDYLLKLPKNLKVFQGQDELLLSSLVVGAAGGVCGSTNFVDLAVKVMKSFKGGKIQDAAKIQQTLSKLKIYLNSKPFPQVFSFLFYKNVLGEDFTGVINILSPLTKKEMDEIDSEFAKIMD